MDPDGARSTAPLFVSEHGTPATERYAQGSAAGDMPRPSVEEPEQIAIPGDEEEPIPQREAPRAQRVDEDLTSTYLPSLDRRVDEDAIWPTLRQAYAKIYWEAAKILQVGVVPNTPESKHRDKLRVYARAIRTISEPEFRKQSRKEWPKLLNAAWHMLDKQYKDAVEWPKKAVNQEDKVDIDRLVDKRAERCDEMHECIVRHEAILRDLADHMPHRRSRQSNFKP